MPTTWEYRIEVMNVVEQIGNFAKDFNGGASMGWEAFTVIPGTEEKQIYVFFRRPKTGAV